MMNWNDLRVEQEIAQERYQRLIRDKEIERLIRQTRSGIPLPLRFLVRLGQQLEQVGQKLEAYGTRKQPDVVRCS